MVPFLTSATASRHFIRQCVFAQVWCSWCLFWRLIDSPTEPSNHIPLKPQPQPPNRPTDRPTDCVLHQTVRLSLCVRGERLKERQAMQRVRAISCVLFLDVDVDVDVWYLAIALLVTETYSQSSAVVLYWQLALTLVNTTKLRAREPTNQKWQMDGRTGFCCECDETNSRNVWKLWGYARHLLYIFTYFQWLNVENLLKSTWCYGQKSWRGTGSKKEPWLGCTKIVVGQTYLLGIAYLFLILQSFQHICQHC